MSHISKVNYDLFGCMNIPGNNLIEYMNWDLLRLSTWNETYLCKYMNLDLLFEYMNWDLFVWIHELGLIVWVHEMHHLEVRAKTGFLGIRIMCPSGATSLLFQWSSTIRIQLSVLV